MTSKSATTRRIVVGVDGSPPSIEALRWAGRLGDALGVKIDAVISWEYPSSYGMAMFPPEWHPDLDAAAVLEKSIGAAFGDKEPNNLEPRIAEGYPSKVLLDSSVGAEMLVVGDRGHGGFSNLLLGSISAHCVEHASCPVLVVRAHTFPKGNSDETQNV